MTRRRFLAMAVAVMAGIGVLAAATMFFASPAPGDGAASARPLAITNVTVINVAAGVAEPGMSVIVDGGRITAVGPADDTNVPSGATVINGQGQFLIPGLWDMHVHTSSDEYTREILFPLFIANGITGIRDMKGDCFARGVGACHAVASSIGQRHKRRQDVDAGTLVGPRDVASSAFANGPDRDGISTVQGAGTVEHARMFVRLARSRGVNFIKVYDMIPGEAYFALADEANRLGLPFAGHVPVAVRASEASAAGQRSIEHCCAGNVLEECSAREDELRPRVLAELKSEAPKMLPLMLEMVASHDAEKCAALFAGFVKNGTWFTPTLMTARLAEEIGAGWAQDPRLAYLPKEERKYFAAAGDDYEAMMGDVRAQEPYSRWSRRVVGDMQRAGVRLLAGSDAGSEGVFWGFSLHEELALMVSAGLTSAEALRAATLGPAEFLGATKTLGAVETGKLADLVLLSANPLDDISNTQQIVAVVAQGRLFDREALDGLLAGAARAARDE